MCSYHCISSERFVDNGRELCLPVFKANETFDFNSDERKIDNCCSDESDDQPEEKNLVNSINCMCDALRGGISIMDVTDCIYGNNTSIKTASSKKKIVRLQNPNTKEIASYVIEKYHPGPVHKHSITEDIPYTTYLTADSKMVVITVNKHTGDNQFCFVITYIDFKSKQWSSFDFKLADERLGSHMMSLHGSQLFICFKVPIKVFIVDFYDTSDIKFRQWASNTMKASRFLSCLNFIVIYDSQTYPDNLLCLTVCGDGISELCVEKPSIFLKESVESLQVLNVNGSVILLAQTDSILLFLALNDSRFMVLKRIDFSLNFVTQKTTPLIIKHLLYWKDSSLYVPIARMKRTFPEDDDPLSEDFIIAVLDLRTFDISCLLHMENKVDIYKEDIHLTITENGNQLEVRKLRKSTLGKEKTMTVLHVFSLFPATLQRTSMNALMRHCKKRYLCDTKDRTYPKDFPMKLRKMLEDRLDY